MYVCMYACMYAYRFLSSITLPRCSMHHRPSPSYFKPTKPCYPDRLHMHIHTYIHTYIHSVYILYVCITQLRCIYTHVQKSEVEMAEMVSLSAAFKASSSVEEFKAYANATSLEDIARIYTTNWSSYRHTYNTLKSFFSKFFMFAVSVCLWEGIPNFVSIILYRRYR